MSNTSDYCLGQRWLSHSEAQLGLGVITEVEPRRLHVAFPAVEDERIYAIDNAPLCRIIYRVGDLIKTNHGVALSVTAVDTQQAVLRYIGVDEDNVEHTVLESELDAVVNLSTPLERLFAGHIDRHRDFKLKIKTLELSAQLQQSRSRGLIGARTEHIPHQVYIASEVASRFAPRVLLADEVGLGKTIEAGLIMHHQLITGRARRMLIIVPETLVHQWLVEMLRRFNLAFSILDKERCLGVEDENPFETEQLVITSLEFLMSDPQFSDQAHSATWDLVVVDEAHHLHWSVEKPSAEYRCVEQFALNCRGLLLLTATPEQLGVDSHFARLRLLDSSRFHSLDAFIEEEEKFAAINALAEQLLNYAKENDTDIMSASLQQRVGSVVADMKSTSIAETVSIVLDQHGTGRVLFRNTRASISGFPKRVVHAYPLEKIDDASDPKPVWLIETIRKLRPHKVLIITALAETAIALEKHLRLQTNIKSAAFHEGLSIIERDRAAAYFADFEDGAECLICSEIGSEGRNFQFAHELVLFDLPLNPELLEQRIGRLDRIGQRHDINIHVPFVKETAMEALFHWYHQGLNIFESSCSFGFSIYEKFELELAPVLQSNSYDDATLQDLIQRTSTYTTTMQQKAEAGRDRLLELGSSNKEKSEELIAAIEHEEDPDTLKAYMDDVFNVFGVSQEFHSEHTEIIRPSEHMKTAYFPGLKEDGVTVTYSREKALVREDITFLSVEHPMVREVMEMIVNEDSGSAAVCTMSLDSLPPGTMLLEAVYTAQAFAPDALDLNRYLSSKPIRVLNGIEGKNIAAVISHQQLSGLCKNLKRYQATAIVGQIRSQIETMAAHAQKHAEQHLPRIQEEAKAKLHHELGHELRRLIRLKRVNKNVREEELEFLKNQISLVEQALNDISMKLEALRIIISQQAT